VAPAPVAAPAANWRPSVAPIGAPAHAEALIAVMNSEPELRKRVTAAVRVGGRRWNVQIEGRIDEFTARSSPQGSLTRPVAAE